jgi:large subunit ribosomal protein L31
MIVRLRLHGRTWRALPSGVIAPPREYGVDVCRPVTNKEATVMKKDIHPEYAPVVFRDISADFSILTRSTLTSTQSVEWEDGNTYPVVDVDISSASHPFYTGKQKILDTAGRVEKFRRRYAAQGDAKA